MAVRHALRSGTAIAPGTCGELVQGWLGGEPFLVTFPVDRYSRVTVDLEQGAGCILGPTKAGKAVRLVLELLGARGLRGRVRIQSRLPSGKGMASSTADVVAAAQATARALGRELPPQVLARVALAVEPSDGVMFPGVALFDHRGGRKLQVLGGPPAFQVLVLDAGGTIDTGEFNARADLVRREAAREPVVREALQLVARGLDTGRPELVARGATLSALAQEELLPKGNLPEVLEWAREAGAWGVNAAHSGTVLGVLFPPGTRHLPQDPPLPNLGWVRPVAGGVR